MKSAKRRKVLKRDNYRCLECGSKDNLTVDHAIPKSKGGTNEMSNIITLCEKHNKRKGNRLRQKYVLMAIEANKNII